ncbi:MAG: hypothetical protein HY272_10155 [Gammaproteobacteria bacterium]|nr:hypothetical protein [Gammaproteobacteria bacterium]
MKIVSSSIQLHNQHQTQETEIEREHLRAWIDRPGNTPNQPAPTATRITSANDQVTLSAQAQSIQPVKQQSELDTEDAHHDPVADTKLQALITFVEHVTGKRIKLFDPSELQDPKDAPTPEIQDPKHAQPPRQGWGVEYDYYHAHTEEEQMRFQADGIVKTADGKEIGIALELNLSRRFVEEQNINLRAGDATRKLKDPLVLNFNGNAAELTEHTFRFDLDTDGRDEQVAILTPNSGYLALDKNGDGAINNGSELFGAQSGNGFADLATYDEDGNHWIDENDSIYQHLRIWNRDASGKDSLIALGQRGVGAVYLGNIRSPFNLTTANNTLLGQVASSGMFLYEHGGAGSVQQLNLVV